MSYPLDDTIVAVASARGPAARGVVRLSGPDAIDCVWPLLPAEDQTPLRQLRQTACLSTQLTLPLDAAVLPGLPCTLYVWPGRRSYTRQPVVEIHTLGSPPLLDLVVESATRHGARLAQPGEFTLRAFLAGRLDLMQAEAVLGLIDAQDAREFTAALDQMAGGLSGPLVGLRNDLLDLLADLEAGLDFVDEDLNFVPPEQVLKRLRTAAGQVGDLQARLGARQIDQQPPRVVLYGWPNVGKSSLFNALLQREEAIVSARQGTTRDYLAAPLELGELVCQLIDTAGLDPDKFSGTTPDISQLAQQAGARQRLQGDVLVLCLDSSRALNAWEEAQLSERLPHRIIVWTKADQLALDMVGQRPAETAGPTVLTSSSSGLGLESLRQVLRSVAGQNQKSSAEVVVSTARRCRQSLADANEALLACETLALADEGGELLAVELRHALDALGQVLGATYTNDLLDRIFSRFCIGK